MCLNRQVDSIRITLQRRNLHRIENGLVRFSVNRVLGCNSIILQVIVLIPFEPYHEKTGHQGFQPGLTYMYNKPTCIIDTEDYKEA